MAGSMTTQGKTMSRRNQDEVPRTPRRQDDAHAPSISNRQLGMYAFLLVIALVLGYLFLSKLVDISQEEDCALAHRRNCGASTSP
jgi:hypothetical protein